MERGWDVTGLLAPLWKRVGGRDALAKLTAIQPSTLSGYNTGRLRLGRAGAERIVAAVPGATFDELGIPADREGPSLVTVASEIRQVREIIDSRSSWLAEVELQLQAQTRLLRSLEAMAATVGEAVAANERSSAALESTARDLAAVAKDLRAVADDLRPRRRSRPA